MFELHEDLKEGDLVMFPSSGTLDLGVVVSEFECSIKVVTWWIPYNGISIFTKIKRLRKLKYNPLFIKITPDLLKGDQKQRFEKHYVEIMQEVEKFIQLEKRKKRK